MIEVFVLLGKRKENMQVQSIFSDLSPNLITQVGQKAKKEGSSFKGVVTRLLKEYLDGKTITQWATTQQQQTRLKKRLHKEIEIHTKDPQKKAYSSIQELMIELDGDDEN